MKKEVFNFDDEDENSEKKRQNEGLAKKRRKNFESDEKEIVSMKNASQAREYHASTYKRPNIFKTLLILFIINLMQRFLN